MRRVVQRLAALAALLAWAPLPMVDLAHAAAEPHVYCPTHAAIEDRGGETSETDSGARGGQPILAAAADSRAGHGLCAFSVVSSDGRSPAFERNQLPLTVPAGHISTPERSPIAPAIALLASAPKTSPPTPAI